jgi:chromosomal replication initiator protein
VFPAAPSREAVALWSSVRDSLATRLSLACRTSLAEHTACLGLEGATLRVSARASELGRWVRAGHLALVDQALSAITDGAHSLAIIPVSAHEPLERDPYLSLASFIVSPANAPARDLARQFVGADAPPHPLLLIHGPAGSGKSHLVRAMAAHLNERACGAGVLLLTSEQLTMEIVRAIWDEQMPQLRARLGRTGALFIDDVDQLDDKRATQDELATALAALIGRGARVALTSSRSVAELGELTPELAGHLASGRGASLTPPEWETRVAIILDRVRRWPVDAGTELAALLAGRMRTSLEELEVVLTRLMAHSSGSGDLADAELVKRMLDGAPRRPRRLSPDQVIALVARHFDLRLRDLRSPSRSPRLTTPRQIAMYLMRRHCGLSYPEIGRRFERHHTTAIHSDRLVQKQLQHSGALRSTVVVLEKELIRLAEKGD